jgi:hypothetical protein
MRFPGICGIAAVLACATPASAQEWGPPTADYRATVRLTQSGGESLSYRFFFTEQRQRLEYRAGEDEEVTIVDQAAAAVYVLRPSVKRYRISPQAKPEYDFGVSRADTRRERIGEDNVAALAAVKYRVESRTEAGDRFQGFAWIGTERIVLKLEGELTRGRRTRGLTMTLADLVIGPIDPGLFRVPAEYTPIEPQRR